MFEDYQYILDSIRAFFEGDNYKGIEPIIPIPVNHFEISKFVFVPTRDELCLKVFIGNPLPFIGPNNDTVMKLKQYLNMSREGKPQISIIIIEVNIWKFNHNNQVR